MGKFRLNTHINKIYMHRAHNYEPIVRIQYWEVKCLEILSLKVSTAAMSRIYHNKKKIHILVFI